MNTTIQRRLIPVAAALSVCLLGTTAFAQRGMYGGGSNRNRNDRGRQNDLRASAVLDDKVNITIRGDRVFYRTLSGNAPRNAELRLNHPLPRRNVNVSVDKHEGRGDVSVVQQPRRDNDYTAIIRVNDPRPGASRYTITANW